jgi:hypothetical protein
MTAPARVGTMDRMSSSEPLDLLPEPYALALRLAAEGVDVVGIADAVDVDPDAVPSLLVIARAKLIELDGGTAPRG